MNYNFGKILLTLGALIAFGTAIAHTSCIYFGVECYRVQGAPNFLVESAQQATFLAPIAALLVSSIFVVFGLYAISAAGFFRKLPFLKFAIYSIGIISVIRGLLPLQLWLRHPDKVNDYVFNAGVIWLVAGLLYLFGYRLYDYQAKHE